LHLAAVPKQHAKAYWTKRQGLVVRMSDLYSSRCTVRCHDYSSSYFPSESPIQLHRFIILYDNYRLSFPSATRPCLCAVDWVDHVSM